MTKFHIESTTGLAISPPHFMPAMLRVVGIAVVFVGGALALTIAALSGKSQNNSEQTNAGQEEEEDDDGDGGGDKPSGNHKGNLSGTKPAGQNGQQSSPRRRGEEMAGTSFSC